MEPMKEMETDETDNSQLEDVKIDEHSCPVCGKVLSSLQNGYRHLETVHTEGDVLCHICGKVFKRKDHLATHLKFCKLVNCPECKDMHPESKMKNSNVHCVSNHFVRKKI